MYVCVEGDQEINTCVWGRRDHGINTCVWGRVPINTCVWGRGAKELIHVYGGGGTKELTRVWGRGDQGINTCVGGGRGGRELIRVCVECVCGGGGGGGTRKSYMCVCGGEDQVIFVCGRGEGPRNYYMYVRVQIFNAYMCRGDKRINTCV